GARRAGAEPLGEGPCSLGRGRTRRAPFVRARVQKFLHLAHGRMRGGSMSAAKTVTIAVVAAAVAVAATLAQRSAHTRSTARATGDTVPRYAGDSLIRPDGFERWVLAGASMGLGY